MGKYFTIVLITEKTSKVKKIRIPINLLYFLTIVGITGISFASYVFYDYYTGSRKILEIDEIHQTFSSKENKIDEYYESLKNLSLNFDRLDVTKNKLRSLTNLEDPIDEDEVGINEHSLLQKFNLQEGEKTILALIDNASEELLKKVKNLQAFYKKFNKFSEQSKNFIFSPPTGLPAKGMILSGFQYETDPFSSNTFLLNGISIGTRDVVGISATGSGIVVNINEDELLGWIIEIYHNSAYKTIYGLLDKVLIEEGDIVSANQKIATVSKDGLFKMPHYYYEIRQFDVPQNPNRFRNKSDALEVN